MSIIEHALTRTVNELSTTIDLESTLIRAEALFRRFQRTVEAIDKKSNFPAPALRKRPTSTVVRNASLGSTQSLTTPATPESPKSPESSSTVIVPKASTSGFVSFIHPRLYPHTTYMQK
jgi:hypothetical protein